MSEGVDEVTNLACKGTLEIGEIQTSPVKGYRDSMMPNTTLLDPTSQGDVSAKFLAPRFDSLDGKVMGLLNIAKNGSDIFLDRIAELMQERFDLAEVIHVKKPTFTRPAPTELLVELAEQADFVIEGLAD